MFKELKVILSASIQKLKQGIKNAIGVVSGGERKIKQSTDKINQSMNNAFGGDARKAIDNLNSNINRLKSNIARSEKEIKEFNAQLIDVQEGTEEYDRLNGKIRGLKRNIKANKDSLKQFNAELRENKTNLANSRLAAEDNQSALESMSRTLTAVTGAVLLMDSENESLRNTMKVLNVAFAATNAVVSINNLRLRENQLFLKASAAASRVFGTATEGATASMKGFRAVLASLGIGLVIIGITELASKISQMVEKSSEASKRQEEFNKAIAESGEEVARVRELVDVIEDTSLSIDSRKKALKDLQSIFPNYFKNLDDEKILTGQIKLNTEDLTKAIIENAKARAIRERIAKNESKVLENSFKIESKQEELNKIKKEAEAQDYSSGSASEFYASRIKRLTNDLNELKNSSNDATLETIKLENQLKKLNLDLDPFTGGGGTGGDGKTKAVKKSLDQITNVQTKALILEERLRAEQEKKFLKTEEEKERAAIASEERILQIRKSRLLQDAQAQNLSASQIAAALRSLELEEIKLQNNKSARIQAAVNKDTGVALAGEKLKYDQTKEALEGSLALEDRITNQSLSNLATAYQNGLIDQETYELAKLELHLEGLMARKKTLIAFGEDIAKIEQQIADTQLKIQKKSNSDIVNLSQQTAVDISQVVSREFSKVGRDIADALSDAFSSAFEETSEMAALDIEILKKQNEDLRYTMQDATKSQLEQLQAKKQLMENEAKIMEASQSTLQSVNEAFLTSLASFLDAIGKGLIAAAAAKIALDNLAADPVTALIAGVAAIAAAAFVRSRINQGVAFADGGIVSGPTLGLVGEYPGASTNPEVIAPLDKLKSMIGGGMAEGGYIAETRVSGRDLALVLTRYNNDKQRS